MKNGILNDLFSASNKKLVIGLILIILLLVINGSFGVYSLYKSNKKTVYYYHTVKDAKDIQIMYQTQINIWKNMIQNRENVPNFSRNYYQFSKQAERIQDSLFNLKIKFIGEDDKIGENIDQMRQYHQKITDRYVSLIFENLSAYSPLDSVSSMKENEEKLHNELEMIASSITNLADKEVAKATKYYLLMMSAFLVLLTVLAIVMVVMIITAKRRE